MRNQVFLAFFLLLFTASYPVAGNNYFCLDPAQSAELIKQGVAKLNFLKTENKKYLRQGKNNNLNFVVNLTLDTSGNYINSTVLTGKEKWVTQPTLESQLNSKLRQVYFHDTIECYLILINYLDLKVKASVPAGITINDLFATGKFFNENSNIDTLKAQHRQITAAIIGNSTAGNDRSCIVLSYGNYCGPLYSDKLTCYTLLNWHKIKVSNAAGSVFFDGVYETLQKKLQNCVDAQYVCGNNHGIAKTAVDAVVSAAKVGKYRSVIMKTFEPAQMAALLTLFSSNNDYYALTTAERLHILSVLVSGQMLGNYNFIGNGQEGQAIKVIRYTPLNDVITLLHGLENESTLNHNNSYSGDKTNTDALIYRLVGRIDDGWLLGVGGDNYLKLNQAIADLTLSSQATIAEFSQLTPETMTHRMIYWDESYTFNLEPIGLNKYDVEFSSDGQITYQRHIVSKHQLNTSGEVVVVNAVWEDYPSVTLKPFDLVAFINRSHVSMIGAAGTAPGELNFMPALFLKYAKDKVFNANTMKVVATTVDIATLATGPGLLFKAARAGKMACAFFESVNMIGAGANLTLNVINIQNPQVQALVEQFNSIIGIWGLTRITVSGTYKLSAAFSDVMDESKSIANITEQQARNFVKAYDDAKATLNNTQYTALTVQQKEVLARMNEFMVKSVGVVNGSGINSLEEFWAKVRPERLNDVKNAFTSHALNFTQTDIILIRHCKNGAPQISNWLTEELLSPTNARIKLALPNSNTAERIIKIKVPKGTPYVEGGVASQVGNTGFGNYAIGGGHQYYFLDQDKLLFEVIEDIPNPLN